MITLILLLMHMLMLINLFGILMRMLILNVIIITYSMQNNQYQNDGSEKAAPAQQRVSERALG